MARSSAVPNRSGSAATQLDRDALHRHAERAPLRPARSAATICGSSAKRSSSRLGIRGRADHREPLARVAPAARVAGHLAAERLRDAAGQLPGARRAWSPRGGRGLALARERVEDLQPRASARRPERRAAGRPPRPRGTPPACGRRAPARAPRSASRSARGSGRARSARAPARARAPPAPRSGRSPRSSRSRASIPGPIPRSSRTRPARTSPSTGTPTPRISSAPRRYARIVYGFASASSSSEANASRSVGDGGVVHRSSV